MSTRCAIAIKTKENEIKGIYCHHDGYIEWVGKTLQEEYNTEEKILKLQELGDLSSLDKTPEECTAYHRDYNEELVEARTFKTVKEFRKHFRDAWCEYFYLFEDGKWTVYWYDVKEAHDLQEEIRKRGG